MHTDNAYSDAMLDAMRTTLIIDPERLEEAQRLTGIRGKTAVVRAGLDALIAREKARRLAALGGSQPDLEPPHRRRSQPERREAS